jgi:hypothetical protein
MTANSIVFDTACIQVHALLNEKYTDCMSHCDKRVRPLAKPKKDGKKGLIAPERGGNFLRR